jgi:predicted nuclease with TOPRIM domain
MESVTLELTSEELNSLQSINEELSNTLLSLGQIEISKSLLEENKQTLLTNFSQLQQKQEKLAVELTQKYGDGDINLTTGEFTKS